MALDKHGSEISEIKTRFESVQAKINAAALRAGRIRSQFN